MNIIIDKSIFSNTIRAKQLVYLEGWQDMVVPTDNNIEECGALCLC
jgi:hypothetical protein